MNDEQCGKRNIVVPYVKANGLTMEWLKGPVVEVINKNDFLNLYVVIYK